MAFGKGYEMENIKIGLITNDRDYGKALGLALIDVYRNFTVTLFKSVPLHNELDRMDLILTDLNEGLDIKGKIVQLVEKPSMINKDYDYLEKVIAPSVTLHKENDAISYDETAYEYPLMNNFDYANFEFRGYMEEGEEVFIILGVYNVSYEFTFVKSKSPEGNYLLKSLYTN